MFFISKELFACGGYIFKKEIKGILCVYMWMFKNYNYKQVLNVFLFICNQNRSTANQNKDFTLHKISRNETWRIWIWDEINVKEGI